MPDSIRTCRSCGGQFVWTEKEEQDYTMDEATGDILDGFDPKNECKSCRIKQDGQRS